MRTRTCPHCGAPAAPDNQFCGSCGGAIPQEQPTPEASTPSPPPPPGPSQSQRPGAQPEARAERAPSEPPPEFQPPPPAPSAPQSPPRRRGGRTCLFIVLGVLGLTIACVVAVVAAGFLFPDMLASFLGPDFTGFEIDTGGGATVDVINNLDVPICYVYISPTDSDDWGQDWLGDQEVIEPGASRSFSITADQSVDLQVLNCAQEVLDQQFEVYVDSIGITYTLDPY